MNYVSNTHLNRHKWRLAAKHYKLNTKLKYDRFL